MPGKYPSFEQAQRRVEFLRQYHGVWPGITDPGGDGWYQLTFDPGGEGGEVMPQRGPGTGVTTQARSETKPGKHRAASRAGDSEVQARTGAGRAGLAAMLPAATERTGATAEVGEVYDDQVAPAQYRSEMAVEGQRPPLSGAELPPLPARCRDCGYLRASPGHRTECGVPSRP
jgi:hypothetical protein